MPEIKGYFYSFCVVKQILSFVLISSGEQILHVITVMILYNVNTKEEHTKNVCLQFAWDS